MSVSFAPRIMIIAAEIAQYTRRADRAVDMGGPGRLSKEAAMEGPAHRFVAAVTHRGRHLSTVGVNPGPVVAALVVCG